LDVVGATTRHDLVSVASLVGLPLDALKRGASVAEAAEAHAARQEHEQRQGEIVARTVDLFRHRPLHWIDAKGSFTLSLGDKGWLRLVPEEASENESWSVYLTNLQGHRSLLASGLSLAYAQGTAEDHAREAGAGGLVNPHARWRQGPASEKQLYFLRRLGVAFDPDITCGEASDIISEAKRQQAEWAAA
jgi:hypothetical protein